MFTLYRKRGFSELVNDTFSFLKQHGRHFFKHYLIITGVFTLILCGVYYLLFKVYFEILFSAIGSNDAGYIDQNINNNLPLIIILCIALVVVGLFSFIINLSYPAIYLKLLDEHRETFGVTEVIREVKKNLSKYIIYLVGSIFIFLPILLVASFICVLLFFILIGIPIMLIIIPFIIGWMNLTLYFYINESLGFFEAMGKGSQVIIQKFWPTVFSNLIMLIIIQVVVTIITMIPYLIFFIGFFVPNLEQNLDTESGFAGLGIIMSIIIIVSVIINLILMNLIWINNGMLYYSHKETSENKQTLDDIDLIGTPDA
jgi:hypothetical protein